MCHVCDTFGPPKPILTAGSWSGSTRAGQPVARRSPIDERLCHRLKESQAAAGHKVVTENQFGKESHVVVAPVALCVPARLEAVGDR